MPYAASPHNPAPSGWPGLASRPVQVGGVRCTYEDAVAASQLLAASRTSAIAPVLAAAGNPLAACDYFAVSSPFMDMARELPKTGKSGAAGRHVTKTAFLAALAQVLGYAEAAELGKAMEAFGTDERYAAAMAAEAVAIRERAHLAAIRAQVRQAVETAVTQCEVSGRYGCALEGACGTGSCMFADPLLKPYDIPAPAGRTARPRGHVSAGEGFSASAVVAAVAADHPFQVAVRVKDGDSCTGTDAEAA